VQAPDAENPPPSDDAPAPAEQAPPPSDGEQAPPPVSTGTSIQEPDQGLLQSQDNPALDARFGYLSQPKAALLKLLFFYNNSASDQLYMEFYVGRYMDDAAAAQLFDAVMSQAEDVSSAAGYVLQNCQQVMAQAQGDYARFLAGLNQELLANNYVALDGTRPEQTETSVSAPAAPQPNVSAVYADIPGDTPGPLKAFSAAAAPAAKFRTYDISLSMNVQDPPPAAGFNGDAGVVFLVDASESCGTDLTADTRADVIKSVVNQLNLSPGNTYSSAWVVVFGSKLNSAARPVVDMAEQITGPDAVDKVWSDAAQFFSPSLNAPDDNYTNLASAINYVVNNLGPQLARTAKDGSAIPAGLMIMSDFEQSVGGSAAAPVQIDLDAALGAANSARYAGYNIFSLYDKNGAAKQWAEDLAYQLTGAYTRLPGGEWMQNDPAVVRFFPLNFDILSQDAADIIVGIQNQIRDTIPAAAAGLGGTALTVRLSPDILDNFDIVGFDPGNVQKWLTCGVTDQNGNPIADKFGMPVMISPDSAAFDKAAGLLTLHFGSVPAGVSTVKFTAAAHNNYDGKYDGADVLTGGAKDLAVLASAGLTYDGNTAGYTISQSPTIDVPPLFDVSLTCGDAAVWLGAATTIKPAINFHWPSSVTSYADLISGTGAAYRDPADWAPYYTLSQTLTYTPPGSQPKDIESYADNQANAFNDTSAEGCYTFNFKAGMADELNTYFDCAASVQLCVVSGTLRIEVSDFSKAANGDAAAVMLKGADGLEFQTTISVGNYKELAVTRDYDFAASAYMPNDYMWGLSSKEIVFDLAGMQNNKYKDLAGAVRYGAAGAADSLYAALEKDLTKTLRVSVSKMDTPYFKDWSIHKSKHGKPMTN